MLVAAKTTLRWILATILLVAMVGCSPRPTATTVLSESFPEFERLELRALWVDEACRYISYQDVSYTSGGDLCDITGLPEPVPFTPDANETIDEVVRDLHSKGVPLTYLLIHPSADRWVGPDSFFVLDRCDGLVFDPGWRDDGPPPGFEEVEVVVVDAEWFAFDFCS
jgi:hypothetical protein